MRSGTLEISSVRWEWQVVSVEGRTAAPVAGLRESSIGAAGPEPDTTEAETLLELEDPNDPRSRMSRTLPVGAAPESEAEARALARDPDERTVVDERGQVWRIEAVERPEPVGRQHTDFERPPLKVRYTREGEPRRVGRLPEGRTLGEASRSELLDLVRD